MRKSILIAAGVALIAVATTQGVAANERHHARKVEQLRKANNQMVVEKPNDQQFYSPGWSAPAGR